MLEMVQRQAQVDEVRWSRLQAELASSQNLSVMIFTTFTVIFLPLTFFTGLFGMNTIEWQEEDIPSLGQIGAISLPTSALLIILSLVAAFSWRVQSSFKGTYKVVRSTWKMVKGLYTDRLESTSRKEVKRRKRQEKKKQLREAKRVIGGCHVEAEAGVRLDGGFRGSCHRPYYGYIMYTQYNLYKGLEHDRVRSDLLLLITLYITPP